ncbi:MAG: LysM peptidoglycan-binding domain-containing protein [Bacteroidetes bacterium]|nr:MAG: LysM peptidoglycan-binding domain-containing protein [Bacteroidota bacterium]REK04828.1 MAG: LysM peptidoglycan-binding domain-containing protein [Bacteroidota bacterium]REK36300.1 MAG: LysM peptidoglycan-binding domain-containing protein [Bacteroidota bacterium]REK51034.1 MAG: LysM peptidoglycan-binding domain-containing protein [Bacteroidota bacterium]
MKNGNEKISGYGIGLFGLILCLLLSPSSAHSFELRDDSTSSYNPSALSPSFRFHSSDQLVVNEAEVRAGLLYDAVNRKIVWQKNMHSAYPIASLTKMMGALLVMEDVKKGLYTWDDNVSWTRVSWVGSKRNQRKVITQVNYTLRDVFKASMIASNNECAEQLAVFLGKGDLSLTIQRMNDRARELGMMNTRYGNPTGLPATSWMNDNSSTPVDQLILSLEMLKYDEILEIAGMGYASIVNGKTSSIIRNHNRLTIDYSGEVDGLKTGYTKRAGFCLAATTAKCNHRLVSIVLGCRGPQIRNEIVRDMINDYYTIIGLERLGPASGEQFALSIKPAPPTANASNQANGEYVTITERIRKVHVVKSGENLSLIASKYKCSVQDLRKWNTIRNGSVIHSGQKLSYYTTQKKKVFMQQPANGSEQEDHVPLLSSHENQAVRNENKQHAAVLSDEFIYHVVAPGDTLFSIANKYGGATVEKLKSINQIIDSKSLKPGMKIKIPVQG